MIADRDRVQRDLLQDGHQELASRLCRVRHAGAVDDVAGVENEEVDPALVRLLVHVRDEGEKVAVVRIYPLVSVTGDKAVHVRQVQQVDRPPLHTCAGK